MSDLYEQDFIGWTEQQARLLRQAAAGSNLGLDWANLIEEVESLGRSEKRALGSELRRVVVHLLKLEHSPALEPRAGWQESLSNARAEILELLKDDPGLRPRLPAILREQELVAAKLAADALQSYREETEAAAVRRRTFPLYTQDQVLGDWLPQRPDPS